MDLCFLKEFGISSNTSTCKHHNWQNDPCRSVDHTAFLPNTDNSRSMTMELGNPVLTFSTSSSTTKSTTCEARQLETLLELPGNSLLGQPSKRFLFQMGDELSAALISGLRGGLGNFDSELQNERKQNCSLNQVHLISGQGCAEDAIQELNSSSHLGDISLDSVSGLPFFSEPKEDLLEAVVAGFPSSRKLEPISCSVTIDDVSSQIGSSEGPNFIEDNNKGGYPLEDSTQVSSSIELQKSTNTNATDESTSFIQNFLTDNNGAHSEGDGVNGHEQEDTPKTVRKIGKQGKTGRPRPKDRQQIQDRVRELRDIVPNANKCSIDVLLERTITYIKFLHTVTQHVGRWSYKGEFKISGKEAMTVMPKESEIGASWAVDLGANGEIQRRNCPIIVENLSQPGLMLVEILCENKGIFLEIANNIRGLGLTILKGVMEVQNGNIWGRFVVEALRDIHRMEVLWSLAHIIELVANNGTNTRISN